MPQPAKQNDGAVYPQVVKMLVALIEEKGDFIAGHAERVAGDCVHFARSLGLPQKEIDRIYLAALLHDIGMIYVPPDIIRKPDKLTDDEMALIKKHPRTAETVLAPMIIFKEVIPIIRHHHEDFDGSGYPDGLRGEAIPFGSRLLSLVDTYEAMIAPRAHRPALTMPEALVGIGNYIGRKFDKTLAEAFIAFIRKTPKVSTEIRLEKKSRDLRDAISASVRKLRNGEIVMPVLPKVIYEIQRVLGRPDTTSEDIARVIEQDGVVSVKLIKVGNSSTYRGTEPFSTVHQAITRMGIQQVSSIVTAIASKNLYHTSFKPFKKMMERLWLHSLATAYIAREVGQQLGLEDPDQLFLQGLLHDIGMTMLIKALEEVLPRGEAFEEDAVIETLREFHTSIGGALLQRWKFPKDFCRVAEQHEGPHFFETTPKDILVVNFADGLAAHIGYPMLAGREVPEPWELESAKLLPVIPEIIFKISATTEEIMRGSAPSFG